MFDFAWTEIALIGVVALIAIGPKDMPKAIKGIADFIKKARRMAGEFQSHVDEMVKDTELADVRNQISQLRNFNIRDEVEKAVDADGTLRATIRDDPFRNAMANPMAGPGANPVIDPAPTVTQPAAVESGTVTMEPIAPPPAMASRKVLDGAPAFIPPGEAHPSSEPERPAPAPSFVPPNFAHAADDTAKS